MLTWAQIDLERDEIALTTRKTGKSLLIPIAAPLREHLLSLPSGDNPRSPVHPRAFEIVTAQDGRVGTLSNQFSDLLVAAGLRGPQPHRSRGIGREGKRTGLDLSFHSLRHTAVSLLKDAGVPDSVVQALVGHESAAMSASLHPRRQGSARQSCEDASRNLTLEQRWKKRQADRAMCHLVVSGRREHGLQGRLPTVGALAADWRLNP